MEVELGIELEGDPVEGGATWSSALRGVKFSCGRLYTITINKILIQVEMEATLRAAGETLPKMATFLDASSALEESGSPATHNFDVPF